MLGVTRDTSVYDRYVRERLFVKDTIAARSHTSCPPACLRACLPARLSACSLARLLICPRPYFRIGAPAHVPCSPRVLTFGLAHLRTLPAHLLPPSPPYLPHIPTCARALFLISAHAHGVVLIIYVWVFFVFFFSHACLHFFI